MLTDSEIVQAKALKLSKNFTLFELINSASFPSYVDYPIDKVLEKLKTFASYLEEFRAVCTKGSPVTVNSGWRNSKVNAMVGGVTNSVHKIFNFDGSFLGVAADVVVPNLLQAFKDTRNLKSPFKTFIYYPTRKFIHLDTCVSRDKKTWFLSTAQGRYVELTEASLEGFNYGTGQN